MSWQGSGQMLLFPQATAPRKGRGRTRTTPRDRFTSNQAVIPELFDPNPPTRQARLCVLGSGSSGNASVLNIADDTEPARLLLIDAGLGPRTVAKRLAGTGATVQDIQALCVTHLDRDHFSPTWISTLVRERITVFVHRGHLRQLERVPGSERLIAAGLIEAIDQDGVTVDIAAGLRARTALLPHDRTGSAGYVFELVETTRSNTNQPTRIGYATDVGRVTDAMLDHLTGVDLLAIESNYDPAMQQNSARPESLKRRVMGGWGHLSNEQAFDAIQTLAGRCPRGGPRRIVLLHRSRQCNHPDAIHRVLSHNPQLAARVTLSDQSQRSGWLTVR